VPARIWLRAMADPSDAPDDALARVAFDGDLDRPCRELSFGNLRKLTLVAALAGRADLVVIDEIGAGLDAAGRAGTAALVAERVQRGGAVIAADQIGAWPDLTDQRHRIADGRLSVDVTTPGAPADVTAVTTAVTTTLAGPAARLADLHAAAARLGFRPRP
jgi:ABC-type multidrug transport system ATPase subunit